MREQPDRTHYMYPYLHNLHTQERTSLNDGNVKSRAFPSRTGVTYSRRKHGIAISFRFTVREEIVSHSSGPYEARLDDSQEAATSTAGGQQ
jgi:hypothetical protein